LHPVPSPYQIYKHRNRALHQKYSDILRKVDDAQFYAVFGGATSEF